MRSPIDVELLLAIDWSVDAELETVAFPGKRDANPARLPASSNTMLSEKWELTMSVLSWR